MRYVYAVYQERSFSKAAKKLFITQPALSAMVKKAEADIGCEIFDRSKVPLTVTKEGQYYIHSAERILLAKENILRYYADLGALEAGHLAVGGSSYFCAYVLSDAINRFKKAYPKIQIDLLEDNLAELKAGLASGSLDLIIETALSDKDETLTLYFLGFEDIVLCVPAVFAENEELKSYAMSPNDIGAKKYQSADVAPVPLSKLKTVPFILLKKGNDMYDRGRSICQNAGFTPQCNIYLDQMLTSLLISERGMGAVFMRTSIFQYYLPPADRMVYYKIGDPLARRPVYMASRKGRYLSKAAEEFLRIMGCFLPPEDKPKSGGEPL